MHLRGAIQPHDHYNSQLYMNQSIQTKSIILSIDNISNWYDMNNLCINKKKSSVTVIGSEFRFRSLNLDNFVISVNADKLLLAEQAKYIGLLVHKLGRPYSWIVQKKYIVMLTCFVVWGKSSHYNYQLTFTNPIYNLKSTMDYLFGVLLQNVTQIVYSEFRIYSQGSNITILTI